MRYSHSHVTCPTGAKNYKDMYEHSYISKNISSMPKTENTFDLQQYTGNEATLRVC